MKNFSVYLDVSSYQGKCHEVEQAIMDLFTQNPLLQTREGTVIDLRVDEIKTEEVNSDDCKDEINSRVKDEPVKIKKNH